MSQHTWLLQLSLFLNDPFQATIPTCRLQWTLWSITSSVVSCAGDERKRPQLARPILSRLMCLDPAPHLVGAGARACSTSLDSAILWTPTYLRSRAAGALQSHESLHNRCPHLVAIITNSGDQVVFGLSFQSLAFSGPGNCNLPLQQGSCNHAVAYSLFSNLWPVRRLEGSHILMCGLLGIMCMNEELLHRLHAKPARCITG